MRMVAPPGEVTPEPLARIERPAGRPGPPIELLYEGPSTEGCPPHLYSGHRPFAVKQTAWLSSSIPPHRPPSLSSSKGSAGSLALRRPQPGAHLREGKGQTQRPYTWPE